MFHRRPFPSDLHFEMVMILCQAIALTSTRIVNSDWLSPEWYSQSQSASPRPAAFATLKSSQK
jgi:hypothetical protein